MEIIKRNWKLKITSLVIAIFFWSFVIVSENPVVSTRINNVQIVYENVESLENRDLVLTDSLKQVTDVLISGQRNSIINMTPQHIRITADFNNLEEGTHNIRLSYNLPEGISLDEAPETITVNIEKVISRDFFVNVQNTGTMQENYILEVSKPNPEKITIKGARSKLDSIEKVDAYLNLNNITGNINTNEEIKAYDKEGKVVDRLIYGQQFVNVHVEVSKQKEVNIIPNLIGQLNSDYRIDSKNLNRSRVLIKGAKDVVDKLENISTQEIDISNLKESKQVSVKLSLPADIDLVNEDATFYVDFQISKKINKEVTINKNNINVLSKEGDSYTISENDFKVLIKGFTEDLDKISDKNIKAEIDISGKSNGKYTITPKILVDGKELSKDLIEKVDSINITVSN